MLNEAISRELQEGDSTTRILFEQILADEEKHHGEFLTLLGR